MNVLNIHLAHCLCHVTDYFGIGWGISLLAVCSKTTITVHENMYNRKNHFYEMKEYVGMSLHEKERNKKMPTPRHKVTHNPIPTSLFCFDMLFVCLL